MAPLSMPELDHPALAWAHPVVREWFLSRFGSPTEPQIEGWPAIVRGDATLISAPTGSGKTLTAFLVAINQLVVEAIEGQLPATTQIVYVSPLKALSNDVQKNLDGPLREILQLALERGLLQQLFRGEVGQVVKDVGEREAVLFGEADVNAVVGGGGLQLIVKPAAKTLAQGETPGAVDAAAEGRVQDELSTLR